MHSAEITLKKKCKTVQLYSSAKEKLKKEWGLGFRNMRQHFCPKTERKEEENL